ncbi:MAG TPA: replication initiator, partial [Acidimicrobiales bacterium]|nr:replication initiator [Acidimicrobiales bacterium]
ATYHAKYDRYGTGPRQPRHRPRGARRHDPAHPPAHRWLSSSLCKTMTAHSQCRPSLPTTNAKVAELQQRGVVHFHSIIRLDAPRR